MRSSINHYIVNSSAIWRNLFISGCSLVFVLNFVGCANFGPRVKAFLGGKPVEDMPVQPTTSKPNLVKFSESPNAGYRVPRNYRPLNKETLEQEAKLNEKAGSLWVTEGQGAYLFTENVVRQNGDILNVRLEGAPLKQLKTKVRIIKDLLAKLEQRRQMMEQRRLALANRGQKETDLEKGEKNKNSKDNEKAGAKDEKNKSGSDEKKASEEEDSFAVSFVPARIIERQIDGNYRVKGSQQFMIGQNEYKVVVTGIVRSEDFLDEGVPASKLLDPQFDILSLRRKGSVQ